MMPKKRVKETPTSLRGEAAELEGGTLPVIGDAAAAVEPQAGTAALSASGESSTREEVLVEVRRKLGRADLREYVVGDVVASVRLAPGWDLNALVDHVREGFCGRKKK